ncbi:MAG: hypothetical protein JXR39_13995 [Marinilabiliaceae bacterium]|nr:hypothetical protein [Marinilabiliaceae bacterium]
MEHHPNKYMGKYRITSTRLQTWDYGSNAPYFVTICTHNRVCCFGNITAETPNRGVSANPTNQLSPIGQLARQFWLDIPNHFPFVKLGESVVMPNHVHGIVMIDKPDGGNGGDAINRVSKQKTSTPGGITGQHNPMLYENLSRVMRWYKGRVSFECKKIAPHFAWQSRFHDHIIRNDDSFERITRYIINNPKNWRGDIFHSGDDETR